MANGEFTRKIRPEDIALPEGYKIEVFTAGLTTPSISHSRIKENSYTQMQGLLQGMARS
jgi:hypothetical protein